LAVAALLALGARVGAVDARGWTAAHAAARFGQDASLRRLLQAGASCSARTGDDDKTPLHLAAAGDHVDCFRVVDALSANALARGPSPPFARQPLTHTPL